MIRSFKDDETRGIWEGRISRRLPVDIQQTARRKLRILDAAQNIQDLKSPPGNRLEPSRKDRKGQHSVRINDQWRICFVWKADGPHDVEIVDYH